MDSTDDYTTTYKVYCRTHAVGVGFSLCDVENGVLVLRGHERCDVTIVKKYQFRGTYSNLTLLTPTAKA